MTTPRVFKDNKAGLPYLFGEKLPAANATNIEEALRRTERALYRGIMQNWTGPIEITNVSSSSIAAAYDATLGIWAIGYASGTVAVARRDPSLNSFSFYAPSLPAVSADVVSAASSGLGNIVFGLAPGGATTSKILQSNDGITWTLRTIGAVTMQPVSFIRWDAANARFVALVSTGEAYTSSDGVNWTSRTVPAGLAAVTWVGLQISTTGMCVATASGTANYMTSADGGITWIQRSGPTNGADLAYAPGVGPATANGGFAWGTTHVSADGISWSAMTSPPAAAPAGETKLVGVGPMFVAVTTQLGGTGGGTQVELAFDQANPSTWTMVAQFRPTDGFDDRVCVAASENQLLVIAAQSTSTVAYRSLSMGN